MANDALSGFKFHIQDSRMGKGVRDIADATRRVSANCELKSRFFGQKSPQNDVRGTAAPLSKEH